MENVFTQKCAAGIKAELVDTFKILFSIGLIIIIIFILDHSNYFCHESIYC